jgi:type IV fimbrial biogenesis protein FimT
MNRRQRGLTLIELMVTLAVAIVLLAVGIPAFNAFSARDASAATVNALVTALQVARVEALSGRQQWSVCACTIKDCASGTSCGTGTAWSNGWMVRDGTGAVVRSFSALRGELKLTIIGADPVAFDHLGLPPLTGSPATRPTSQFTVTAYTSSAQTKCVRITDVFVSAVGQVRSEVKSCP